MGWDEPQEDEFASDVTIVLASAEFSKELTTAVLWLNERDIDIRCIKLKPYKLRDEVLLDVQQIFPLPEAADYQIRLREKEREERRARIQNRDIRRFHLTIGEKSYDDLPKRKLAFLIIKKAVDNGATPLEVYSAGRRWLVVFGDHDEDSFLTIAEEERDSESSTAGSRRFFTANDELMKADGKTYALTNQWGIQALPEVDRIIEEFDLTDVSYQPM